MILKLVGVVVLIFLVVISMALVALYLSISRPRKKAAIDSDYEPVRAKDYPPAFPNGWFSLCRSEQVKKRQVIEVTAFGHKLAVFRGEDGQVGAVDVFCPHLGANLADGRVSGNRLVCPFHAWEFNTEGVCEKIPYCSKEHYSERTQAKAWLVKENWGLILAWYHANNEPPSWDTEGYLEDLKDCKHYGSSEDVLKIHLQDFAENGADYAHFDVVHNLMTIPLAHKFIHVKHTTDIRFGEGKEKHMAWFTDLADIVRNKDLSVVKGAGGKAVVTYYGPGFLVFQFYTRFGNPTIVKTFTPLGALRVRMEDHVYAPKGSFYPAIKYVVGEATAQFHDDINIWERKCFKIQPVLVKGDGPIMQMRKWYSQFYSMNTVTEPHEVSSHQKHSERQEAMSE